MSNFNTTRFDNLMGLVRTHLTEYKANVQQLLVMACYFAYKDGNTTPLNQILDMAVNSKAIPVERITRWVELHAQIAFIKKEQFALNKKQRESVAVTNEESFKDVEKHLMEVSWYDIMKKEVAKSAFDVEAKAEAFIKQLEKHMHDPDTESSVEAFEIMIKAIRAAKGEIAKASIVE